MSIIWYKNIKAILKGEPELWLAYLQGQQLENLPHLTGKKSRYRGLSLQLSKFSYLLIRRWRPFSSNNINYNASYFFFAGTSNQIDSLNSTIDALRKRGAVVIAVAPKNLINCPDREERYTPLTLKFSDLLKTLLLVMIRGPSLYQELKKLHPEAVSGWYADFCFVYAYLCYFQRILSLTLPEFVVTANDHSVPNRCMIAVAHQMGIETAYLQHASVSKFFPALRVNYAFLDGQSALNTYRQCEKNQPDTDRQAPLPKIFLSGQKKSIIRNNDKDIECIGIALNSLDDIDIAIGFISQISDIGYNLFIRWHPAQTEYDIKKIRDLSERESIVILSDPKKEPVSSFLSRITWLVAGNSSIHLEAVLAGVSSVYYELTPVSNPDYYGYVKNGLALEVSSVEEFNNLVKCGMSISSESKDFIRYYSSTYKTEWEGREGELVAKTLESLKEGKETPIDSLAFASK